jgi:hypothetical protein
MSRLSTGLTIEAVIADVIKNGMRHQIDLRKRTRIGIAETAMNGLSNLRCADLDLKSGQDKEWSALSRCVAKQIWNYVWPVLSRFELKLSLCLDRKRLDRQSIRQGSAQAFEMLTRP